jgi:hypothetical protein
VEDPSILPQAEPGESAGDDHEQERQVGRALVHLDQRFRQAVIRTGRRSVRHRETERLFRGIARDVGRNGDQRDPDEDDQRGLLDVIALRIEARNVERETDDEANRREMIQEQMNMRR